MPDQAQCAPGRTDPFAETGKHIKSSKQVNDAAWLCYEFSVTGGGPSGSVKVSAAAKGYVWHLFSRDEHPWAAVSWEIAATCTDCVISPQISGQRKSTANKITVEIAPQWTVTGDTIDIQDITAAAALDAKGEGSIGLTVGPGQATLNLPDGALGAVEDLGRFQIKCIKQEVHQPEDRPRVVAPVDGPTTTAPVEGPGPAAPVDGGSPASGPVQGRPWRPGDFDAPLGGDPETTAPALPWPWFGLIGVLVALLVAFSVRGPGVAEGPAASPVERSASAAAGSASASVSEAASSSLKPSTSGGLAKPSGPLPSGSAPSSACLPGAPAGLPAEDITFSGAISAQVTQDCGVRFLNPGRDQPLCKIIVERGDRRTISITTAWGFDAGGRHYDVGLTGLNLDGNQLPFSQAVVPPRSAGAVVTVVTVATGTNPGITWNSSSGSVTFSATGGHIDAELTATTQPNLHMSGDWNHESPCVQI